MNDDRRMEVWLEVSNIRIQDQKVSVQLKADKADQEPVWWVVKKREGEEPEKVYRRIIDGLDKKRIVLAALKAKTTSSPPDGEEPVGYLYVEHVRVQLVDSPTR